MTKDYELFNNEEERQYEFHIDAYIPRIEYIINQNNVIYLTHTEVQHQLEGQGVGKLLVEKVLADIEAKQMKLVPMCPFVAAYIRKYPEWKRLVAF